MDLNKRYFIASIHFSFSYEFTMHEELDGTLTDTATSERYRKRLLYDCGWGQEDGYEMLPPLPFSDLIYLVESYYPLKKKKLWRKSNPDEEIENRIRFSNLLGSVAVIMQDHVDEFIDFISVKIYKDYFNDSLIRNNFKWFSFSSLKSGEEGRIPGGIMTQSYEDVLKEHLKWEEISSKVIETIYR